MYMSATLRLQAGTIHLCIAFSLSGTFKRANDWLTMCGTFKRANGKTRNVREAHLGVGRLMPRCRGSGAAVLTLRVGAGRFGARLCACASFVRCEVIVWRVPVG